MKAARARNPRIHIYGLSWGAPGWIGNGSGFFGPEMVAYQTQWVKCMEEEGISVNSIGVWNERYWGGADYVRSLRAGLDEAGFAGTQIIIPDGGYDASIMAAAASDPAFNASFAGIGLHYPCNAPHPEVQAGGKLFWASEDWWAQPTWGGAAAWGHLLVQNYVRMNMTTTIAWSPLWAVYDALADEQAGLILASEPWSGHWEVSPPVWTGAQFTQFTDIGWRFLSVPSGGSGELPGGGFYVSLVPPEGQGVGLTVVLETLASPRCPSPRAPSGPQTVTFQVVGGAPLPPPGTQLHVWATNASALFVNVGAIPIAADGTFSVTIAPDSMVTLSTVGGAQKGAPRVPIPASAPFPFPFATNYSGVAEDGLAPLFADQFGSFAVRGGRLTQVAAQSPGANGWSGDADPLTVVGDSAWGDYRVACTLAAPAPPPPPPLADGLPAQLLPCGAPAAAGAQRWAWDAVAAGYVSGSNGECFNVFGCQKELVFWRCVTSGGTCCGASCYAGLQWARPDAATGALVSALPGALCATASEPLSPASALTLAPCSGGAGQRWAWNASTQLLELRGSGLCLSQAPPPPPPPAYARLCGRIRGFDEFSPKRPLPGYCVELRGDATWRLTGGGALLASGALAPPPAAGEGVPVELWMNGTSISALVRGARVARVEDDGFSGGRVALGASFGGYAAFGAFEVGPLPTAPWPAP